MYHLDLPAYSRIHPIFHACQLKRAMGYKEAEFDFPSDLEVELPMYCVPELVLAFRSILRGDESMDQWLIHWTTKVEEVGMMLRSFKSHFRLQFIWGVGGNVTQN